MRTTSIISALWSTDSGQESAQTTTLDEIAQGMSRHTGKLLEPKDEEAARQAADFLDGGYDYAINAAKERAAERERSYKPW